MAEYTESTKCVSAGVPASHDLRSEEVVEVEGEPISRSQARQLGIVDFDVVSGGTAHEAEAAEKTAPLPETSRAAASEPLSGPALKIGAAKKFLAGGNMEEALALAQEVVHENGASAEARVVMVRAFMGMGDYAKTLAMLQAVTKSEETAETLYLRGLASASLNRRSEAVRHLQAALAKQSADPEILEQAKKLLDRLQQPAAATLQNGMGWNKGPRARPVTRRMRRKRRGIGGKIVKIAVVALLFFALLYFALRQFAPTFLAEFFDQPARIWTMSIQPLWASLTGFFR